MFVLFRSQGARTAERLISLRAWPLVRKSLVPMTSSNKGLLYEDLESGILPVDGGVSSGRKIGRNSYLMSISCDQKNTMLPCSGGGQLAVAHLAGPPWSADGDEEMRPPDRVLFISLPLRPG